MVDLEAMILAKRNNAAGGFLSYMEQKYCKEGAEEDLPDESMFEPVAPGSKKRKPKAGASSATTAAQSGPKKRAKNSK